MENSVERVDWPELVKNNVVESEDIGDMVVESTTVDSGELNELEEEVFKEAVESQEMVRESGLEAGTAEPAGDSSSVAAVDDDVSKLVNGDRFEEAIDSHEDGVKSELENGVEASGFGDSSSITVNSDHKLSSGNEVDCSHEASSIAAPELSDGKMEAVVIGESKDMIDEGGTRDTEPDRVQLKGENYSEIADGGGIEIVKVVHEVDYTNDVNSSTEILHEINGVKEELDDSDNRLSKHLEEITAVTEDKDIKSEGSTDVLDSTDAIHGVGDSRDVSSIAACELSDEKMEDVVIGESKDKIDEGGTREPDSLQLKGENDSEIADGGGIEITEVVDEVDHTKNVNSSREILHVINGVKEELDDSDDRLSKHLEEITAVTEDKDIKSEGSTEVLDSTDAIHGVGDSRNVSSIAALSDEKMKDVVSGESKDKVDEGGTCEPDRFQLKGENDSEIADGGGIEIVKVVDEVDPTKDVNSIKEILHEINGVKEELDDSDDRLSKHLEEVTVVTEDKDIKLEGSAEVLDSMSAIHAVGDSKDVQEHCKAEGANSSNAELVEKLVPDSEGNKGKDKLNDGSEAADAKLTAEVSNSELDQVDVVKTGYNNVVGGESRLGEEKNGQVKKQNRQVNKPREIQSTPNLASYGKPTTPSITTTARPAGLGHAAPLLDAPPRSAQHPRANGSLSQVQQSQTIEDSSGGEGEECDETQEKLQMIRVKFLRLAHRLGQTPHNVVVAQVLYRLGLAEQLHGRNGTRVGAFSFDRASAMAEQLEAAGQEPLDFACTIMVLGKTGVGKSATINSIFDRVMFATDAFESATRKVQEVAGLVQGIKVRVIDTPGLFPSSSDQHKNVKILQSVKRFIKNAPPDIVLYLDRLDMQSRDFGDMPLLGTINDIFGTSIWFNAIVVLTHAASAPPEGPNGTASSYDMFVTQRSHVVQQAIRQAAGDMRLMNPVSLVENHSACRTNRAGQRVLPNGQVWKPQLLLLSFASKILGEANALLKLQDSLSGNNKAFVTRSRTPPLPYLLSSFLQSIPQVRIPDEVNSDDEDDLSEDLSDDESEYDDLPPFKSLTQAQVAKLTRAQKKAYFDELEYREKLFMKKQLKEERRRRKMMKKMAALSQDMNSEFIENAEEEGNIGGAAATVPVPMPDLALPASFDSDNPTHRYRYLDTNNQWLVRPVLETHGWDHDVGYEGLNVERLFVLKDRVPVSFSGQITKDKKDKNVQMEVASSVKHGQGKSTSLAFDMQTVGKDCSYTLRSETLFTNFRKNKATAGLSVTLLGDTVSTGVKIEDKFIANKQFQMIISGAAMTGRGDVAYGGSLEAQLRDKDYPLGRSLSTLGVSVIDWHGDLALGCNLQSQFPVGRSTNLIARANLNNKGAGQVSLKLNSSEQLQIALVGLFPLLKKLFSYSQQLQFGQ